MKRILYILYIASGVALFHGCSDDGFPVPPASTVPLFSVEIGNNEFAPATVVFTNESVIPERAGTVTYSWSFGDGTTSSEVSPTHFYTNPGVYTVGLVIVSKTSLEIKSLEQAIVIKDPNAAGVPLYFFTNEIKMALLNDQPPVASGIGVSGVVTYGMVVDTVNSKIYITDDSQGKIFVSNADGSDFKVFRSGIGSPNGIALDYETGTLYYGTGEGNVNTSDVNDETIDQFETVVSGQDNVPTGLAIDPVTRTLFWNNYDGGLWSKNLDAAGGETKIIENPEGGGSVIVVGDRIYYDEYTSGDIKIKSTRLDGSDEKTLITGISRLIFAGIAYNEDDGKLYWGDRSASTIRRANLDGSGQENFYVSTSGYPRAFAIGKKKL
jgi:PKD repeat protein